MTFDEMLSQVLALLQHEGRLFYRALKLRFNLDDDYLEGLKDELIEAKRVAVDEGGRVLVWTGRAGTTQAPVQALVPLPLPELSAHLAEKILPSKATLEGERKQVTVLFADSRDRWNCLPTATRRRPDNSSTRCWSA
jgi:hypothetical protein